MTDEEEREEFERKHRKAKELYESLQEEKMREPEPARELPAAPEEIKEDVDIPQTTAGDTKTYTEKQGHQYVHGKDTSEASQRAHDDYAWNPSTGKGVERSSTLPYRHPKHVTEIPQPEASPDKFRRDPRTEGTPIDSPFFQTRSSESLTRRILEAPRRIKEKAEEIGYRAEQKYDQVRGKPTAAAAQNLYDARSVENDLKFHRGEINKVIHTARQNQYEKERAASSVPLEKRLVGDINNLGQGGMIRNAADTFTRGAVGVRTKSEKQSGMQPISVMEKFESTYRPSPQPRLRPGSKGTRRTSPTKGTVVSNTKKAIDFGKSGFLGGGLGAASAFQFNTPLFQKPPQPVIRKTGKRQRGR